MNELREQLYEAGARLPEELRQRLDTISHLVNNTRAAVQAMQTLENRATNNPNAWFLGNPGHTERPTIDINRAISRQQPAKSTMDTSKVTNIDNKLEDNVIDIAAVREMIEQQSRPSGIMSSDTPEDV